MSMVCGRPFETELGGDSELLVFCTSASLNKFRHFLCLFIRDTCPCAKSCEWGSLPSCAPTCRTRIGAGTLHGLTRTWPGAAGGCSHPDRKEKHEEVLSVLPPSKVTVYIHGKSLTGYVCSTYVLMCPSMVILQTFNFSSLFSFQMSF